MAYAIRHSHVGQVQFASGIDVLAAIWLFISPFVIMSGSTMAWNNCVFGVIIFILAACRAFGAYRESWISWVNLLLGIWVLIAPFALLYQRTPGITTSNVITGIVLIVFAAWSGAASGSADTDVVGTTTLPR
jgi:uncharacterized membrane protein